MTHTIYLVGATGKMGRMIAQIAAQTSDWKIIAGLQYKTVSSDNCPFPLELHFNSLKLADVIIDFSRQEATERVIGYAVREQKPLIIGTTGLSIKTQEALRLASENISVFYSANFSLGAYLCLKQAQYLAHFCKDKEAIKISETHHAQKKDAPSGTALSMQKALNDIYPFEIPITSNRQGDVIGEHKICFKLDHETIELKHEALSRKVFALGALRAADFLIKKQPGFFGMEDLIQELKLFSPVF